uniref:Uncharacterized protein n=1 Tax=Romanomermis culicivorax TaxID=13658 RepID=A0A915K140_ROMCU
MMEEREHQKKGNVNKNEDIKSKLKEMLLVNAKNLADINKSRKPPIIISPDLMKKQQQEKQQNINKRQGKWMILV